MTQTVNFLDQLENSLYNCVRTYKSSSYYKAIIERVGTDIDRPSMFILIILDSQSLQFRDLVKKLGVEAPSVSRKVHELEAKGLVMRETTRDKRIHLLTLTDNGHKLTNKIKHAKREYLSRILAAWTVEDQEKLATLLVKLADDFSKSINQTKEE
jgi:DNA-binding MarR family transcriptional regulator